MTSAVDCGFEMILYLYHSFDLTSAEYYLFPKLESELRGKRFDNNNDVMVRIDDLLWMLSSASFFEMAVKLNQR